MQHMHKLALVVSTVEHPDCAGVMAAMVRVCCMQLNGKPDPVSFLTTFASASSPIEHGLGPCRGGAFAHHGCCVHLPSRLISAPLGLWRSW